MGGMRSPRLASSTGSVSASVWAVVVAVEVIGGIVKKLTMFMEVQRCQISLILWNA